MENPIVALFLVAFILFLLYLRYSSIRETKRERARQRERE